MKQINITQGQKVLVDNEDFERINKQKWSFNRGYAYGWSSIEKKRIYMHRLIIKVPKGLYVDHINGNKLDNRKENLRFATIAQNQHNQGKYAKKATSIYKGVYWHKNNKIWQSQIKLHGVKNFIGRFKNELHAAMAYDLWAKELHGDYAKLNFKSI